MDATTLPPTLYFAEVHMIEGQNTHDQIPSYAFHSFLVEVQTNPTHA